MVIGADKMSLLLIIPTEITVYFFGDAGAALLLEPTEDKSYGQLDSHS
jgi:3-oxoacyl-[acyl-carrier-protein] synthase III